MIIVGTGRYQSDYRVANQKVLAAARLAPGTGSLV
jgi:hypothetical protein